MYISAVFIFNVLLVCVLVLDLGKLLPEHLMPNED